MLRIIECKTRRQLRAFMELPRVIYGDRYVRPMPGSDASLLNPHDNPILSNGPYAFLLALDEDKPVARILTGSDEVFCKRVGLRQGYISLFDAYDRPDAAALLFEYVARYHRALNNGAVVGPNPPDRFGFGYGVLVQGFDAPPSLFSAYNAPYYERLLLENGFIPHEDHYGYRFSRERLEGLRYGEAARWAGERFGVRVEKCDLRAFARVCRDIRMILGGEGAGIEEIAAQMHLMKPYYQKELFLFARVKDEPAGFLLGLPDGAIARGREARAKSGEGGAELRIVTLYVNARFRRSGVTAALFGGMVEAARELGIERIYASTICEKNIPSLAGAERAGGKIERIYRQYRAVWQ